MADRSTCEIRDWVVFGPGYWRGALYSPADCERVPENFARLRGYIDPVVKLGHDREQVLARLKSSSGFPNLGDFAAVTPKGGGRFAITLVNVPVEIGRLINAGRIRSGSVELIPFCDDPRDQGKRVAGPIITAVALLGEEHPAVKGVVPSPKAVYPDGTPVEPETNLTPWFEAMTAAMAQGFSDDYDPAPRTYRATDGKHYPITTICFAEMAPMIDAAFLASIGITDPTQVEEILAKAGGGAADAPAGGTDAPPPALGGAGDLPPPPPMGDAAGGVGGAPGGAAMPGPAATPVPDKHAADDQTMMSAAAFSDIQKRLGAMEKKYSDAQKAADEKCMSAFSDRVELVLSQNKKRIAPNMRAVYKKMGLDALRTKSFADVTGDDKMALAAFAAFIESLPESAKFSEAVDDGKPGAKPARKLSPFQQAILDSRATRTQSPQMRQRILDAARPSAN